MADVNKEQAEYWSLDTGVFWLENQDRLDACFAEILSRLIEIAGPRPGDAVLDIGCGTGASTLALADCAGPAGRVLGADISDLLLSKARARIETAGARQASVIRADAQVEPFGPERFDHAVSRMGVMFFEDTPAAFRNIAGALRPGGRMTFACWGPLAENPWFQLTRDAARDVLGPLPAADPDAPGPLRFADADKVLAHFAGAGIAGARVRVEDVRIRPRSALAEIAEFMSYLGTSRAVAEAGGGPDDYRAIAALLTDRLVPFAEPGGASVPARMNYYIAEL